MESTPATAETHKTCVYTNLLLRACRIRKLGFLLLTRISGERVSDYGLGK